MDFILAPLKEIRNMKFRSVGYIFYIDDYSIHSTRHSCQFSIDDVEEFDGCFKQ
jgi:hypothetical protein